ncbi:SemiSWEET family transporter [Flavobacterium sp. HSC-61S13]|uniref:SemiSWEET family transporter n=1 Tax=Flavobacterium sp. HSC-61S13 TaxID=2910963 RepID=UPI00209E3B77|nr:SemiSWEET family transporter [Flavobacterium sp. HSC-61S13]MCP1994390.1 MtN3 and saliva related transmembrane protein [Flavobacterium sp. HSC-61S13]
MEIIIGIAAGILTSISMLPQLVKVIREKDVENLSGVMISVLLIGVILWVAYGIIKNECQLLYPTFFRF